jgi:hypothetical protein
MAKTLSYPNEIKNVYHKLFFSNTGSDLNLTNQNDGEDVPVTSLTGMTNFTLKGADGGSHRIYTDASTQGLNFNAVSQNDILANFNNAGTTKFQIKGDGSIRLNNNTALQMGTPEVGQLKMINNKLYIGVT